MTDILLVGAPMYFSEGRERGKVYIYSLKEVIIGPFLKTGKALLHLLPLSHMTADHTIDRADAVGFR